MRVPVHCVQWVGDPLAGAPNVKRATKENLVSMKAAIVKIVQKKRFKIKVPVHRALLVPQDGNNPTKVPLPVSV